MGCVQWAACTLYQGSSSSATRAINSIEDIPLSYNWSDNLGSGSTSTVRATGSGSSSGGVLAVTDDVLPVTLVDDGFESVYHTPANPNSASKAQNILDGINPDFLSTESRFGKAFYVGDNSTTVLSELSHHGLNSTHAIHYSIDLNKAISSGYNVIKFNSERNVGGINHAVLTNFNDLLTPKIVVPVKP